MPYQGPLWQDYPGNSPLDAADLNCLVPAQSAYVQSGGLASSATAANPPVITQPATWVVLLPASGAPPVGVFAAATTLPCGAGAVAQDNYVDITPSATYVVTTGVAGFTPAAPAAGNLRLYKATTNSGNAAVVGFTLLAPLAPTFPTAMNVDGSGAASTVALPHALTQGIQTNGPTTPQILPGTTTLNGDVQVQGFLRQGTGPGGSPNTISVGAFGPPLTQATNVVFAVFTSGPGGIITFTTGPTLFTGAPYYLFSIIGIYSLPEVNNTLPYGYRARVLTGLIINEINTGTSRPGFWVDSIKTQTVTAFGNGPNPQTWYLAQMWAKAITVNTQYSFAYMPIFG